MPGPIFFFPSDMTTRFLSFRAVPVALLTLLLAFTHHVGLAQSWRWATAAGGPGTQNILSVTPDSAGNRYVGGQFSGSAQFGTTTLVSQDSTSGFVGKLDSLGNWLWAKALTGTLEQKVKKVKMGHNGQLFFLGESDSTALFDGQIISDASNTFVASLESSSGHLQWVTNCDNWSFISDIAVDASGKPHVCGTFGGDSLRLGTIRASITTPWFPRTDTFIASLTAASGTWDWAIAAGGSGFQEGGLLDMDAQGNIYMAGRYLVHSFDDSTVFGSHVLPFYFNAIGDHLYLAKLSANHTWEWAMGTDNIDVIFLYSLYVQPNGVSYLDGYIHYGELFLGGSSVITVSTPLVSNGFIAAVSPGGRVMWGVNPSTPYEAVFSNISGDHDGNLFVTGNLEGDTLRLGDLPVRLPTGGYQYVAALDTTGHWTWAMPIAGSANSFCVGLKRRLTFAGAFRGSQTFGAFTLQNPTTRADAFAAEVGVPPIIQLFSPTAGPAGTVVAVSGNGFTGVSAVNFGGIPATSFTVLSDGSIQVVVPPGVGQSVPIQVTGPTGIGQSVGRFGSIVQGLASEAQAASFELWPNPAHTMLHLRARTGQALAAVTVRDAVGRVVRHYTGGTAPTADLSLSGLPAGLYVVQSGATIRRLVVE